MTKNLVKINVLLVTASLLFGVGFPHLSQAATPLVKTDDATTIAQTTATLNGEINPQGLQTNFWFEYGPTQSLGVTTSTGSAGSSNDNLPVSTFISGLAPNTTYFFRVVGKNSSGTSPGTILSFTTLGTQNSAPTVTTLPPLSVGDNAATVTGKINPHGSETMFWFQYGIDRTMGQTITQQSAGAGTTLTDVSGSISNLQSNALYYYRLIASNAFGTTFGTILTLLTTSTNNPGPNNPGPTILSDATTGVSQTGAILHGHGNPNSSATTIAFEFGTTQGLGTTLGGQSIGSGASDVNFSFTVISLQPGTTYFFRANGSNVNGSDVGETLSFTTQPSQTTPPPSNGQLPGITTNSASQITPTGTVLNGFADPHGMSGTVRWFEWGTTSSFDNSTAHVNQGNSAGGFNASITGLQPSTTYSFRAVAQNSVGLNFGDIVTFTTPAGNIPAVTTTAASQITQSGATLNGFVDPQGTSATVRWFEWGTSESLGNSTPHANQGNNASGASAAITGLTANTTYFFRIVAQNVNGLTTGTTLTFTTNAGSGNPGGGQTSTLSATTNSASQIGPTSAVLNAYIIPQGPGPTVRWFEWGPSNGSFNNSTSHATQNSAGGASAAIGGLENNTTYFFHIVAQNGAQLVTGDTLSFRTNDQSGGTSSGGSTTGTPDVFTSSPISISQNSATLRGNVDPRGSFTTAWFEYGTTQSLGTTIGQQSIGSGSTRHDFSYTAFGLQPNTTYYYRAVAQNSRGINFGSIVSFYTGQGGQSSGGPSVTTASPTNVTQSSAILNGIVNPNGIFANGWFEYGITQSLGTVVGFQSIGSNPANANYSFALYNLQLNSVYYYRAVGQNSNGTTYGSILSFTTGQTPGGSTGGVAGAPIAITAQAYAVTQTSGILNSVINPNGSFATVWFEWGPTTSLGQITPSQSAGSGVNPVTISRALAGLSPYTTYYYRVTAQNAVSISYGTIGNFTTLANQTFVPSPSPRPTPSPRPSPPPEPKPIVTSKTNSSIKLNQSFDNQNPNPGDEINYEVTYTNIGSTTLKNVLLKIMFPDKVTYESSTREPNIKENHELMFHLGDLFIGDNGKITIKLKVNNDAEAGSDLIFRNVIEYSENGSDARHQFESILAITVGRPTANQFLSLLGGLISLPTWLVNLILILMLVVIIVYAVPRRSRRKNDFTPIHE